MECGVMKLQAIIFDLDGVLTDTAIFHYQAWKQLADEMGAEFNWEINHQLRGVSRRASMEIIFKDQELSEDEIQSGMERKNVYYNRLIEGMTPADVLPGVVDFLQELRAKGIKIGLGSASKNARTVLDAIGLTQLVDVIGDGYSVAHGKPEPDLFLFVADQLGVPPASCAVFEDAAAGIEAAKRAGMITVGIGDRHRLPEADVIYPGIENLSLAILLADLGLENPE
jgi:kojibiose phosphorylase